MCGCHFGHVSKTSECEGTDAGTIVEDECTSVENIADPTLPSHHLLCRIVGDFDLAGGAVEGNVPVGAENFHACMSDRGRATDLSGPCTMTNDSRDCH